MSASQVLIGHLTGEYEVKDERLERLYRIVQDLEQTFATVEFILGDGDSRRTLKKLKEMSSARLKGG
jgi:hypothetical protein